jgi:hypothetical protein
MEYGEVTYSNTVIGNNVVEDSCNLIRLTRNEYKNNG